MGAFSTNPLGPDPQEGILKRPYHFRVDGMGSPEYPWLCDLQEAMPGQVEGEDVAASGTVSALKEVDEESEGEERGEQQGGVAWRIDP